MRLLFSRVMKLKHLEPFTLWLFSGSTEKTMLLHHRLRRSTSPAEDPHKETQESHSTDSADVSNPQLNTKTHLRMSRMGVYTHTQTQIQ